MLSISIKNINRLTLSGLYSGGCCAGSLSVLPRSRSAMVCPSLALSLMSLLSLTLLLRTAATFVGGWIVVSPQDLARVEPASPKSNLRSFVGA